MSRTVDPALLLRADRGRGSRRVDFADADADARQALHESLDEVRAWLDTWTTWCVRVGGRLVGAVRARRDGSSWEIGRLMVAPDLAGKGLGGWLLRFAEDQAPADIGTITLFTGLRSHRNLAMYEGAGFRRTPAPVPPGAVRLVKDRASPRNETRRHLP